MIIRSWRGRTTEHQVSAYRAHLMAAVVPELQRLDGFHGARLLQRAHPAGVEVLVLTEWTSWDAIRAFAGDDLARAVVEPAARAVLTDYDTHVEHFELVETVTRLDVLPQTP